MDFDRFDEFWVRFATRKLELSGDAPLDEILLRLLSLWGTCTICGLLRERTFDILARWQYALAENREDQDRFVESQTWCNRHAWLFGEIASPLGLGRIHRRLLSHIRTRLVEGTGSALQSFPRGDPDRILGWLVGERRCPMCGDQETLQAQLLDALAQGLGSGALRPAYEASPGCCLPHLAMLLDRVKDSEAVAFLLGATVSQLDRLSQRLERHEAETVSRRRQFGEAKYAPAQAMIVWAGRRDMVVAPASGTFPDGRS